MARRTGPHGIESAAPGRERYTIGEVTQLAAVPRSSIHHYRRMGLIPEPVRVAPNRFLYDDRHVAALRIVRRLRRRDLSLDEIGAALPHLVEVRDDLVDDAIDEYLRGCLPEVSPRTRLVETAIEAFATHGYRDVSIADLCDSAGIGKGTFYRYFDDKDALLLAATREVVEQLIVAFADELRTGGDQRYAPALAIHLRRGLPLLLELAKRVLQDPGPIAPAAATLFAELVERLGRAMGHDAGAAQAGGMLVLLAVVDIFAELVEPLVPERAG